MAECFHAVRAYCRFRLSQLRTIRPCRKADEAWYIDAIVLAVHGNRELLYLEGPGQKDLLVIPCPPKYERPCKGDRVTLELRLELRSGERRRRWRTYIIRFPGDGLDRESIHEVLDYDS
jgi:hypothetical protein